MGAHLERLKNAQYAGCAHKAQGAISDNAAGDEQHEIGHWDACDEVDQGPSHQIVLNNGREIFHVLVAIVEPACNLWCVQHISREDEKFRSEYGGPKPLP